MRRQIVSFFSIIALLLSCLLLMASTFYVDPENGDINGDGSQGSPWSTLQEVLDNGKIESWAFANHPAVFGDLLVVKNEGAPVRAGDTILLRNGFHGRIFATEYYNEDYILIAAQEGHEPHLGPVELRSGCRWILSGLYISPEFEAEYSAATLINFPSHSWTGPSYDCIAENCSAYSVSDASGWTEDDWNNLACNAMSLPGKRMTARNNYFRNVDFGISVTGDSCLVEYNTVENFSGDGLRGLGNYDIFQYNVVKNCYAVNSNHDDGFQSWSVGQDGSVGTGVVLGIVLRGNTIINYEDPEQPFRGTLQGVGCFDGMFEEWLVENNVILTDHWHGITLSGATNCVIINNTVADLNDISPGPPWISIGDHKDGRASTGCVVRNNLSTDFTVSGENITQDHNIEIGSYDDFFVDYENLDMRLISGCDAVDSGSTELAPSFDRDGVVRPQGDGVDIGAYEYTAEMGVVASGKHLLQKKALRTYPNPFSKNTVVQYSVDEGCFVSLSIHTMQGREVCSLVSGRCKAVAHSVSWNGRDKNGREVADGVYYLCFVVYGKQGLKRETRQIVKMSD